MGLAVEHGLQYLTRLPQMGSDPFYGKDLRQGD